MSRNLNSNSTFINLVNANRGNTLFFENRILVTSSSTFAVPPKAKVIKFTAVGGGQAGTASTGGPGAGYFEKTFYAPFTGITTSFVLTIGAAGGNTILAYSNSTTIATAYGATAIGTGNTVGIGGTAGGGDVNTNGSPGGTSPGVGGAAGGPLGDSVYNSTYAGRWIYYDEKFVNDNVKNYYIINGHVSGIGSFSWNSPLFGDSGFASSLELHDGRAGTTPTNAGFGGGGLVVSPGTGGAGGYGGGGGEGTTGGGVGGAGAVIVEWTETLPHG
jgi:hypothetical protein